MDIELINREGTIRAINPATGEEVPVRFNQFQSKSLGTDNLQVGGLVTANETKFSDVGKQISDSITNEYNLYIPPNVSKTWMTIEKPISEIPHNGWQFIHDTGAPPINGNNLSNGTTILDLSGKELASAQITEDISVGDTTISVRQCREGVESGLAILRSDGLFNSTREEYTKGEIVSINSVSSGRVRISRGTYDSYTTQNNARLVPVASPEKVSIHGVHIKGKDPFDGAQTGLEVNYHQNIDLINPEIWNTATSGIRIKSSVGATIVNPEVHGVNQNGLGYGINFAGSTMYSKTIGGKAYNCRSGWALTHRDVCRFNQWIAPSAWGCSSRGIGTHASGEHLEIISPQVVDNRNGLYIRTPKSTIGGGYSVRNDANGLYTEEGGLKDLEVHNFTTRLNGYRGLDLHGSKGQREDIKLDITSEHNNQHGLFLKGPAKNVILTGCCRQNGNQGAILLDVSMFRVNLCATENGTTGMSLAGSEGKNNRGYVTGNYCDNSGCGIVRADSSYDEMIFDGIIARGNTGVNFDVSDKSTDHIGSILN